MPNIRQNLRDQYQGGNPGKPSQDAPTHQVSGTRPCLNGAYTFYEHLLHHPTHNRLEPTEYRLVSYNQSDAVTFEGKPVAFYKEIMRLLDDGYRNRHVTASNGLVKTWQLTQDSLQKAFKER